MGKISYRQMVLNLVIPEINAKPENTKDAVISILTIEWPLTLREIFYRIKKKYGYKSSYQAVYKAAKELSSMKVLTEKEKRYELNIDWIKRLQSFTDIAETNYYAKERVHNISGLKDSKNHEDIMILNFETIFDAEKYIYYFMKSELIKSKNDIVCISLSNEWRPLFYLRAEYNYYNKLKKNGHKFYMTCSSDSYLETLSRQFYQSIGINYRHSAEKLANDMFVFGEFLIQIFIPAELKEPMGKYLVKKDLMSLLNKVLSKKSAIRVIITRDEGFASEIKNKNIRN